MEVDKSDPAWQLAEAAGKVVQGEWHALEQAFARLKPDHWTVTRAYAMCLMVPPLSQNAANNMIANTMHAALAERSARQLERLTWGIYLLTAVLAIFEVADHWSAVVAIVSAVKRWMACI